MSLYNDDFERSLRETLSTLDNPDPMHLVIQHVLTDSPTEATGPPPLPNYTATTAYKWRPINQAPKDGTRILGMAGADVAVVCWQDGQWDLALPMTRESDMSWTPTHFLPLSALPTEVSNEP